MFWGNVCDQTDGDEMDMMEFGEGEWSFFVEGEELVQTGGGVMRESVDDRE